MEAEGLALICRLKKLEEESQGNQREEASKKKRRGVEYMTDRVAQSVTQ